MKTPYIVTVSNIGIGSGDYDAGPNAGTAAAEVEYLARRYPSARFTVKLPKGGVLLAARPSAIAGLANAVRRSGVAS